MQDDLPARAHAARAARRRRRRVPPARRRRRRRRGADRARWRASEDDSRRGRLRPRRRAPPRRAPSRLDLVRDRHVVLHRQAHRLQGRSTCCLAAWPLVPEARLVVVGFGGFHDGLVALLDALAAGDREAVREIAEAGRELEGGPRAPLRHLLAFLDDAPTRRTGPRRATCASASCSPGAWSTTSWRRCWPAARRSSSRARSPRPTGWSPPRRRPAACCPSRPGTPARRRSARCWRRGAGGGARLAVVPDRRRRGAGDRRARAALAAGARRTCAPRRGPRWWPPRTSASRGRAWPRGVIAAAQGRLAELPPVA